MYINTMDTNNKDTNQEDQYIKKMEQVDQYPVPDGFMIINDDNG